MKMKRLFSLLLISALLVTCTPFVPLTPLTAEAATASGTCGDNLTWSLNSSGTLTISGTGKMTISWSNSWHDYKSEIKRIVIGSGVTSIDRTAFENHSNLTSVTMANTVTTIGAWAFRSCTSLSSITLSSSLTEIQSWAFYECTGLTSITIPDSVTLIESYAFQKCTKLSSVKLGSSLYKIGGQAFADCTSLTEITLPASVGILSASFTDCTGLRKIWFEGSAPTYIDGAAFTRVTATAYYYPDQTWTADVMKNYGGNITWVSRGCKHSYSSTITQPTCTAQGYTTHRCTKCGSSYKDSYTSAKGHSYGTWSKINDTSHSRTCTVCKKVSETANHSWNSGVITSQETCKEAGIKTYTCSVCKGTKTETIPATGEHSYTSVITPPTCTEQGFTTHTCSKCGDSYKDTYTDAKIHNYSADVTPPTCTEQGYTTHTCSKCGDSYTDTYTKENGHSYGKWITVDGQTHKRTCTVCLLSIESEIHIYNPGTIKKPATCTEDEVRLYRCIYCEYEREEVIPDSAAGHTYGDWEQVDETYHKHTCTVCKTHSETKQHTFGADHICTGCGYKSYIPGDFTGDGIVTEEDVIHLLWHTVMPGNYPLNQNADYNKDGFITEEDVIWLLWHTVDPERHPLI